MDIIPKTQMQWFGFFLWLALTLAVEYWLGRTQKTRAGSMIELVLLISITLYLFFVTKIQRRD